MTQQQATKAKLAGLQATVPIDSLDPNPWNPNVMSEFMFEKERESIRVHGFIDPITVRSGSDKGALFKRKQIVDGEQRWKAAKAEGLTDVIIVDLGRVSDSRAKVLTEVLNKLKGENDPLRWLEMVVAIKDDDADLLKLLPYEESTLHAMLESSTVDWDKLEAANTEHHANQQRDGDGKLFKKFGVSIPEGLHTRVQDLMRKIKAAHRIDDDAAAFKVLLDMAEKGLANRTSVAPPPPAAPVAVEQPGRRKRRQRAA